MGKTNSHSRKWTVDDSRPGRTDATKKADSRMFLEAYLDPSDPLNSRFRKKNRPFRTFSSCRYQLQIRYDRLKKEEKIDERFSALETNEMRPRSFITQEFKTSCFCFPAYYCYHLNCFRPACSLRMKINNNGLYTRPQSERESLRLPA